MYKPLLQGPGVGGINTNTSPSSGGAEGQQPDSSQRAMASKVSQIATIFQAAGGDNTGVGSAGPGAAGSRTGGVGSRTASRESLLKEGGSLCSSREDVFGSRVRSSSREDILHSFLSREDMLKRDRSASSDSILSRKMLNRTGSREDVLKGGNRSDSRDSLLSREDIISREGSRENILTSRESLMSSRESMSSSGGGVGPGYTRSRDVGGGIRDAAPGPASVVRTQSHLARFNNARAMFEKMSSEDKGGVRSIALTGPPPSASFDSGCGRPQKSQVRTVLIRPNQNK